MHGPYMVLSQYWVRHAQPPEVQAPSVPLRAQAAAVRAPPRLLAAASPAEGGGEDLWAACLTRHLVECAEGEGRIILTCDTFFLQAGCAHSLMVSHSTRLGICQGHCLPMQQCGGVRIGLPEPLLQNLMPTVTYTNSAGFEYNVKGACSPGLAHTWRITKIGGVLPSQVLAAGVLCARELQARAAARGAGRL